MQQIKGSKSPMYTVITVFIVFFNFSQFYFFPVFYPYIVSYMKYKNDRVTFKLFFFSFFIMYIGLILQNKLMGKMYATIGILNTIRFSAVLHLVWLFSFILFPYILVAYLLAVLEGIIFTIGHQCVLVYLRVLYPKEGLKYFGYVLSAPMVGVIFFSWTSNFFINQNNEKMNVLIDNEYYYS